MASNETPLNEMIGNQRFNELREYLLRHPVPEIATTINTLKNPEKVITFRLLPKRVSSEVFAYFAPEEQNTLLEDLTDYEASQILAHMRPDDRLALFEELPSEVTQRLLQLLSPQHLDEVRQMLGYPEESVGRLMSPQFVAVHPEWTVEEALAEIRHKGPTSETVNVTYVTDTHGKLLDEISLKQIIFADPQTRIADLMDGSALSLSAYDDQEEAVRKMAEYDVDILPVVDTEGLLLGIVTIDDVFDVAIEEVTEDIFKTSAVEPLPAGVSYRQATVWALFSRRATWLVLLIFANLISSGVIAAFEDTLAATVVLAFFIPLLIDSGGNTGSQSATIMIRALVTGDVRLSNWGRIVLKELAIGACLGLTLGILAAGLGLFRGDLQIALVVALSMFSIILFSNIIGMTLPFMLYRLRLDPTVASSPLITTIADATGLLIYFSIATRILHN